MTARPAGLIEALDEAATWTDANGTVHLIRDMDPGHCVRVIRYLEHRAEELLHATYLSVPGPSGDGDVAQGVYDAELDRLIECDAAEWLHERPLLRKLRERAQQPPAPVPPQPRRDPMMSFTFVPATREQAKARIALQGPAGCGKTKSGLRIAEGLAQGGTIGVVDTERGSALDYAPVPGRPDLGGHEFVHLRMDTHNPQDLIKVVAEAERAGFAVLMIDNLSHFWNGRGGLLSIVEAAGAVKGAGGQFGGWKTANPIEQDMLDALLNFSGHLIVTLRTKTDYLVGEGGKVTKVGTKTVQREGIEYEFGVVIDMVKGTGCVTKTRYSALDDLTVHHPGEELAGLILEQLGAGIDPVARYVDELAVPVETLTLDAVGGIQASASQRRHLHAAVQHPGTGEPVVLIEYLQERLGDVVARLLGAGDLTYEQAAELHARGKREGWLAVPRVDRGSGQVAGLGELIAVRGQELAKSAQVASSGPEAPRQANETAPGRERSEQREERGVQAGEQSELANASQMRKLNEHLGMLGLSDAERSRRLTAVGLLLGRPVQALNRLTFGEATVALENTQHFVDQGDSGPEKFKKHLNQLLSSQADAA